MKAPWVDYSVGERDAHFKVYVGPTVAEDVCLALRAYGLRANAGTAHVYVVLFNFKDCRQTVLSHVRSVCSGVTDRDVVVLK